MFFDDDDEPEFYETHEDTVNSSLYRVETNPEGVFLDKILGQTQLRVGIVISVYDIEDKKNISKKIPEYDVLVVQKDRASSIEPVIYKNCINTDVLGGLTDFMEHKLRPTTNKDEDLTKQNSTTLNFEKQNGTMVLLLCLDGAIEKGIIIKSITHPGRKTTLTKEAGLHLEGEYNGLNWKVDKDGALTVTFKSATDSNGKPQNPDAGGTHFKIDKTGSVDINSGKKGDEETYIRMDKQKLDVGLKSGRHTGVTAEGNIGLDAKGRLSGKAQAIEFEAGGTAKVSAQSSLNLEGGSLLGLSAKTISINGGNLIQISGKTTMVDTQKVFLGKGAGTPAVISTTKFVGKGNHGAPVVSRAVGVFSKKVFVAS